MTMHLPAGWRLASLSDVCEVFNGDRGKNYPSKDAFVPMGVPFVNAGHLTEDGSVDMASMNFITEAHFNILGGGRIKPGDILYCLRGSLGKAAIVRSIERGAVASSLAIVRPTDSTLPEYLYNFLVSPLGKESIAQFDNGSAQPNLSAQSLKSYKLPLPPLNEQRRIVTKLDALTARSRRAKDALDAIPKLLEQFRQSILAAAFRGDLTKDWRAKNPDVEPAGKLLQRIHAERRRRWEDAELAKTRTKGTKTYPEPGIPKVANAPPLPASWVWSTIESVGDVHLGRQRAPQHLIGEFFRPYLRVANIKDDRIDFSDLERMNFTPEEFAHYSLRAGDILLSEGQSPELVGQSAIYRGEVDSLCFQKTLHRFRPTPSGPSSEFAQLVFRHYVKSGLFKAAASLTTNIAHLTLVRLKALRFPLPPEPEQAEIVRRASAALSVVERLSKVARDLSQSSEVLERSLLARAFRGELVPQDPAEEPPSTSALRPESAELKAARTRPDSRR